MKRIILFLILLVLTTSLASAYTYGDSISSVDMPRIDQTMTIDFNTKLTDRWMNPVDQVVFTENGKEYFFQPTEITKEQAKVYVSTENREVIIKSGSSEEFTFGDSIITVNLLESYTYKGHFEFSRRDAPKEVVHQTTTKPVQTQTIPADDMSSDSDSSLIPLFIVLGVALIVGLAVFFFIIRKKD